VQRQYTGTAGRIENAQVAVYLTYAGPAGHALIDRALYLPKSWAGNPARRAAAGVPEDVKFATKPALARTMITRALDGGAATRWVAGDEVYGADPGLRGELEDRRTGYVLAAACSHRVRTAAGPRRADAIAASLPRRAWQRLSAGQGSKVRAFMTGPGSPSTPPHPPGSGPCSSAAAPPPASWPASAATQPPQRPWQSWSASRAGAGPWKSHSRPARA
jgi:SRSO17 transposase